MFNFFFFLIFLRRVIYKNVYPCKRCKMLLIEHTILKTPPHKHLSIIIIHFCIQHGGRWLLTNSHNNNNKLLIPLMMMEETYFKNICLPTFRRYSSCSKKWRRLLIRITIRNKDKDKWLYYTSLEPLTTVHITTCHNQKQFKIYYFL